MPVKPRSEPPTHLITFACPNCKKLNTVKVERVIDFSLVAIRTIVCAGCANSWDRVLPGPICDGPHLKAARPGKLPRRQVSNQQWTVSARRESLTREPEMAVLMLRLGASINALNSARRMTLVARKTPGLVGLRDLSWTFLMAAAQLKEAIDSLLRRNLTVIKDAARAGGASDAEIDEIDAVIDIGPDSLYSRVLKTTRNQIAYHWDEKPFESWRQAQRGDSVVWVLCEGKRLEDIVYLAPAAAVTEAILPNPAFEELSRRVSEVSQGCTVVLVFFQSAIAGYLQNHGLEDSPYPDVGMGNEPLG